MINLKEMGHNAEEENLLSGYEIYVNFAYMQLSYEHCMPRKDDVTSTVQEVDPSLFASMQSNTMRLRTGLRNEPPSSLVQCWCLRSQHFEEASLAQKLKALERFLAGFSVRCAIQ